MRFLLLVTAEDAVSADGRAMARYQRGLVCAGVLLAGDVTAGFWLLEVDSVAEARSPRSLSGPGGCRTATSRSGR